MRFLFDLVLLPIVFIKGSAWSRTVSAASANNVDQTQPRALNEEEQKRIAENKHAALERGAKAMLQLVSDERKAAIQRKEAKEASSREAERLKQSRTRVCIVLLLDVSILHCVGNGR